MKVKIVNKSLNQLPDYATEYSAGMDLRASLEVPAELLPMQKMLVPTGLFIELPHGYEAQVRPRSGLAAKFGVTILNTPGTIDSDYRGEIKVILINLSGEKFVINPGERIAQMIIAPFIRVAWEQSDSLSDTERGEGGFGHTGIH